MSLVKNSTHQYIFENIKLIKSLIIKSETTAEMINRYISARYSGAGPYVYGKYGVDVFDSNDKTTWKYYLNLSGEYHYDDLERLGGKVTVYSLDTGLDIQFTKNDLSSNPITLRDLMTKGSVYRKLQSVIGNDVLLNGILFPVDLYTAIEATDWTILGYDKSLIETQELSTVHKLQDVLNDFINSWEMKPYTIIDTYYHASFLAILYNSMVAYLLNIRDRADGSDETHSFFITQFLASHQGLDVYVPYLTFKQKMFLYRNIRFIERNPGSQKIFDTLIKKLLSDRHIPLSEYRIQQTPSIDQSSYVTPSFKKLLLGTDENVYYINSTGLNEITNALIDLDPGNRSYYSANGVDETLSIKNTLSSTVRTKLLESNMTDSSNNRNVKLVTVALEEWASLSLRGFYTGSLAYTDISTGKLLSVTPTDAYIYMLYLLALSNGVSLTNGISVNVNECRKIFIPTISSMKAYDLGNSTKFDEEVREILNYLPNIPKISSRDDFYKYINEMYSYRIYAWFVLSNINEQDRRCYVENAMLSTLESFKKDLNIIDIKSYVESKGFTSTFDTIDKVGRAVVAIIKSGTGIDIYAGSPSIQNQRAMLGLLKTLSSYTIKIIDTDTGSSEINLNNLSTRVSSLSSGWSNKMTSKALLDINNVTGKLHTGLETEGCVTQVSLIEPLLLGSSQLELSDDSIGVHVVGGFSRVEQPILGASLSLSTYTPYCDIVGINKLLNDGVLTEKDIVSKWKL